MQSLGARASRVLDALSAAALVAAIAACGSGTASSAPPATAPIGSATSPTSGPTAGATPGITASPRAPRPPGTLAWPTTSGLDLALGSYFSQPPFVIPFTFDVLETGWVSAHLHDTFFDLQRYDGVPRDGLPTLMVAFARPLVFRTDDGDVPVAELTPLEALDGLVPRASLRVSDRSPVDLFGQDGVRADVHSVVGNNPIFGDGGMSFFGLGPELDVRIAAVPYDGGMLLGLVLAPPGELAAGWDASLPILESVELLQAG